MQKYSTISPRNEIRAEFKMLDYADKIMVLGSFGDQKEQPLNKSDTIVFRRVKPFNATSSEVPDINPADFITAEGVTPDANDIDYTDVSVTLEQYAVLFQYSSKAALMYEDDIPGDMQELTGRTMGEVAELLAHGKIKAGTNVIYANGSTRAGLNSIISIGKLRAAARAMESNRANHVTKVINPGPSFGTSAVAPSYIVFIHTDTSADVRDLPHFVPREEYGSSQKPVHDREIGACEEFRFVTSPLFKPYLAAGKAVGTDGMVSAGGVSNDVYPSVIVAESAWGHVSLKGNGYTGVSPTHISHKQKNHANPAGQFGYVGADFWYSAVRLNEHHMTRVEHCNSDL